MDTVSVCSSSTSRNEYLRSQQLEDTTVKDNNTLEKVFPWLSKFNKTIHSAIRNKNHQNLEQLIVFYTQNIFSSVAANKIDFDDRVNLMNHVSNILIFCHLYWLDIKQDVTDHNSYLRKMSALLNIYIDMELKISMEKRPSRHIRNPSKIAAKILTALYIYLNNSEEYIFRVLLRIKHTTEKYTKICNHIFTKSFDNTVVRKSIMTPVTDIAYVRYLLALKMWKKMDKISDRKEKINETAILLLGSHMPKLRNELLEFVPKPPTDQENETLWLLQSNLLDLKQAHKYFLLFEDKMDSFADLQYTKIKETDQRCLKSQKHQMNSLFRRNISNGGKINREANKSHTNNLQKYTAVPNTNRNKFQSYLQKKGTQNFKPLKKGRLKTGKTIIIDLTGDDEISIPCKVKRKKIKDNMECLKSIKNKEQFQKHITPLKYSNQVTDNQRIGETFNKNSHYLKSSMFIDQNVKEFKFPTTVSKESKPETGISSHVTYMTENIPNSYNDPIIQNKQMLISQEENTMEAMPFKMYQDNITELPSFKQELSTNVNDNIMQKSHKCCETIPVDMHIKHLIIKELKSINDHNSQITKIIKQKECHQVNECPNCCAKIDCKPTVFINNDVTAVKAEDTLHNTTLDNDNDVNLAYDTNIIYMLSDRNKCVYVVNHIGERVTTMHAEKKVQCLDKPNDTCAIPTTTFAGDQIVECNQHVNFNSTTLNDYGSAAKYSEATMKEQELLPCPHIIQCGEIPSNLFKLYKMKSYAGPKTDNDLKGFLKIGETDEMTKADYVDDLENICFLNNIQSETLEDFLRQFSVMHQVNCNNSTSLPMKKPFVCTDNDVNAVKAQDTLHMFNDKKNDVTSPCDANITYMLTDHDKCVYVANHTGERVMSTNAEKRTQCLDNFNDMCTVSTALIGEQIESSLENQYIDFDNKRKNDIKYSEAVMKEERVDCYDETIMKQERIDCNTSMSNDRISHSSESCIFDINSFVMDSKKTNETMKTDCIDFENIEDVLLNDTTIDFLLPLKQSSFELDNVYTDTFLNERGVLCNNPNDVIDSINSIAFCLNTD